MPKFTAAEAAKVLHVTEGTVRRWISQRRLRAVRRKVMLINAEDLLEFRTPAEKRGKTNEKPF